MADKPANKSTKKPGSSGKKPARKSAPRNPDAVPIVAHEKRIQKKPTGVKGSFFLAFIAAIAWSGMASICGMEIRDRYEAGIRAFDNAMLLLFLPFLFSFMSISLLWLNRTPKRNEVKPLALSSLFIWLVYVFWKEVIVTGRLHG
ncbi:MAG TPA: hypothetical protein VL625_13350 [Patescibacteria group bacterium]|nr:hypothetical protein [Patescibacteria group bacterium]